MMSFLLQHGPGLLDNLGEKFKNLGIIVLVVIFLAGLIYLAPLPYKTACRRRHRQQVPIGFMNLFALVFPIFWFVALIWAYTDDLMLPTSYNFEPGDDDNNSDSADTGESSSAHSINNHGPGLYRIAGVDSKTSDDVQWQVEAQSQANAKVKAELRGIVVTNCEFLSPSPSPEQNDDGPDPNRRPQA